MKDTQKTKLKAVTGMTEIPFVMEGVAADSAGYVITEDGTTRIAEALEAGDAATAQVATLKTSLQTAQAAQKTAEDSLATANAAIATHATAIKAKDDEIAALKAAAGGTKKETTKETDDLGDKGNKGASDPVNAEANKLRRMQGKAEI